MPSRCAPREDKVKEIWGGSGSTENASNQSLSGLEKFFVLGAEQCCVEGGVIPTQGRLKRCVVLLGMEKTGGDFGVYELYVVFPNGSHAKEASAGEAFELQDIVLGIELNGLFHEDGVLETFEVIAVPQDDYSADFALGSRLVEFP